MSLFDIILKCFEKKEQVAPRDYVLKPFCPYENIEHSIRGCMLLHRDCTHYGSSYKRCRYYKHERKQQT